MTSASQVASIDELIDDLRRGSMVILSDDENRENEGDIIVAAQMLTPQILSFILQHARGFICAAVDESLESRLSLKRVHARGQQVFATAFARPIDVKGDKEGESALGRWRTIQKMLDPLASADDFHVPGNVYPVVARQGGVLVRAGHTEASLDLVKEAGMQPMAIICEIMLDNGKMARLDDLKVFAKKHGLKIGTIADLIAYRVKREHWVNHLDERELELPQGKFTLHRFTNPYTGGIQHALVHKGAHKGAQKDKPDICPLVRVHIANPLADILGDAGDGRNVLVSLALAKIVQRGYGAFVLLDAGKNASEHREGPLVVREHGIGSQILHHLGFGEFDLLIKSKIDPIAISGYDLKVRKQVHIQ